MDEYFVIFFRQPNYLDDELDFDSCIEGIEELKYYVEEELKKIRGNRDEKSGESR